MNLNIGTADKLRALAIDEGMAEIKAGRVVSWNLDELLKQAREQKILESK